MAVSGIDGSGKSTQLILLNHFLRSKGFRTYYLWLRWFPVFSYVFYLYARLLKRTVVVETSVRPIAVHVFWIDKMLRRLYPRVFLFDLLLWLYLNKLIAWTRKTHFMLIDRGFLDVLVDLLWEVKDVRFLHSIIVRFAWRISNGMKALILVVEPKEAVKRKNDIVSLREIVFKKRCFEIFAKHLDIPIVDTTNKPILDTFRELMKFIKVSNR